MKKLIRIVVVVIILALVGLTGYLAYQYSQLHSQKAQLIQQLNSANQELKTYKTDPNQAAQADADKLTNKIISDVGKLYALPKDEKPTVYTVKDKEASKKQLGSFFDKANNSDISLIYTKAKIAILYRPSTNQIINVGSLTIQDNAPPGPTTP